MTVICYVLVLLSIAPLGIYVPFFEEYRVFFILSCGLLAIFWFNRSSRYFEPVRLPQGKYVGGLVAAYTLSEAQFLWLTGTVNVFLFWFKRAILFWIIPNVIRDITGLKRLVWINVAAVCILLFYGWGIYLSYDDPLFPTETVRLLSFGGYDNPNSLALILTLTFPLAFSLMEIEENIAKKVILLIFLILTFLSCVYTKSRGGNAGMTVAVVSSIYLSPRFIKSRLVKIVLSVAVLAAFVIYVVSLILSRPDVYGYLGGGGEMSSGDRLMAWHAAIAMFREHPLIGVGWQHFKENAFKYGMDKKMYAHNTMLSVLAETGIIGFFCYVGILWTTIKPLLRIKKAYSTSETDNISIMNNGLLISFLCFFLNSTFSVNDTEPAFWLLVIMVAILNHIFHLNSADDKRLQMA